MKQSVAFLKTTLMGGFFVVFPIVVVGILLGQVVVALGDVAELLAQSLSVESVGGVEAALLIAVGLTLLLCFAAGLAVRTAIGARTNAWLERVVLERIPGYTMVKNLARRFEPGEGNGVALARLQSGAARVLVFVVEALDDGRVVVFLPLAPTPTVGTVYVVSPEDLEILDVSMTGAVNCLMQWGVGAGDLLRGGAPSREAAR
jgi:uncharacterized membrane protein